MSGYTIDVGGLSTEEMQALLKDLQEARFTGASRVKFREREVTFKSDSQMARIEQELIRRLNGTKRRKHVGLTTFSKGL